MAITLIEYQRKVREVRVQQARPSVFRGLFTGFGGAPMVEILDDLTEEIRDTELVPYGEMRVIGDQTGKGVKMTTFDATRSSSYARTAAIGYEISNEQLARLNANNIPIRNLKVAANAFIAERWLEDAVLLGSTQYSFGSFLNDSGVTVATLATKAATGVAWAGATFEEIVIDILALSQAVATNSNRVWVGDTVALPQVSYDLATNKVHTYTNLNAIETAKQRDPRLSRVLPVAQLAGLGSGATNRAMAFCSSPLVAQMSERAYREEAPRNVDLGFRVIETVRTAGTIWSDKSGAVYADGL